jgi:hypothetical protein
MTTERLRRLLVEIRKRDLPYEVALATDILGPGGGVYVKSGAPVTTRHITWFESRNPASKNRPTFIEVEIRREGEGAASPEDLRAELDLSPVESGSSRRETARAAADAVGRQAKQTARIVRGLHDRLGHRYTRTQLSAPQVAASFQEFEREYRRLHDVVRVAVDEFLGGNTLVMDFIVDYDLERPDVRHAVRVGALATELRIRTDGERCDDDSFRRHLVDLFIAGFLHDGGMWNEPLNLPDDHEGRGAALAIGAVADPEAAQVVEKLVLFHSDWDRLAGSESASFTRLPDGPLYERRFSPGDNAGSDVLSEDERQGALALALAERWISDSDESVVRARSHRDLLDGLVTHVDVAPSGAYVAALCNMEIESVAPRRAWVALSGQLPLQRPTKGTGSERLVRTKVDGLTAGSLGHGDDGASPHFITLFAAAAGGKRKPLEGARADDDALWERRGGLDRRLYVPGGRFKNLLSWEVTGFLSAEEYDGILLPYENQARRRGLLPTLE